ncbi:hypothetical protein NM208_g553 [Fusarium decemcellulare]|uniref:Uncharacterized protein n=2 Tax=Fusarium decemcellulare TaxID=57161 RepID=A0ACC1SCE9_9HYPO|nr:hypothetical protein NM208_g6618 [Fusarium decemcellulare]KAJ3549336.1 hypothetical protein NM208_g553 [Fusarium decemcellulare]
MAPHNTLPPEIQVFILERLMEPDERSNGSKYHRSICAGVCKGWQQIIERRTFRHLTLQPSDITKFSRLADPSRRGHIKHILLEIPVKSSSGMWPYNPVPTHEENNAVFTRAVQHLWEVLSTWRGHHITLEIGIYSSFETMAYNDGCENSRKAYSKFLEYGPSGVALPDLHLVQLKCFQDPPSDISALDIWNWRNWSLLGHDSLAFDDGKLLDDSDQDARHFILPEAEVITHLLIRRRYFRNISAKSLSRILKAAPCLETIHLERWCYGRRHQDTVWDMNSAFIGHELPPSLKQFSFYEEFSTDYHQRPRKMRSRRSNLKLLEAMAKSTHHLEHVSISFALDARNFFLPSLQLNGDSLITISLTSNILLSRSNDMVNELLERAAQPAKKMPKLKILELWHCKTGEAGIFRYEKFDRFGSVTWQGTWTFTLSETVRQAWEEGFVDSDRELFGLGVSVINLPPGEITSVRSVFPYLKLKKYILHDVSWTQV